MIKKSVLKTSYCATWVEIYFTLIESILNALLFNNE